MPTLNFTFFSPFNVKIKLCNEYRINRLGTNYCIQTKHILYKPLVDSLLFESENISDKNAIKENTNELLIAIPKSEL